MIGVLTVCRLTTSLRKREVIVQTAKTLPAEVKATEHDVISFQRTQISCL